MLLLMTAVGPPDCAKMAFPAAPIFPALPDMLRQGVHVDVPALHQKEFLESLGIAEAAFGRIIRASFTLLGRIAYFTVGEDEVKAWIIQAGCKAPRAAAVIHNDFERGFIKAEVIAYDEFIACGGSQAGAKAAGKLRLEGKEYIVKDGDIINFRFNV